MPKNNEQARIAFDDTAIGEKRNLEIDSLMKKLSGESEPVSHVRIGELLLSSAINLHTPCLVAFEDTGDEEKALVMLACDQGWIVSNMTDDLFQLAFANWPSHGTIVDTLENAVAFALHSYDSPSTVPGIYAPEESNSPC